MLRLNYKLNNSLMAEKSNVAFKGGMTRPLLRNSTKEEIGRRMRLVRIAYMGYDNASEFARKLEWSPQKYGNYEKGANMPPVASLTAIEGLTGIGLPWLLRGETRGSDYDILSKIEALQERENDPDAAPIVRRRGRSSES